MYETKEGKLSLFDRKALKVTEAIFVWVTSGKLKVFSVPSLTKIFWGGVENRGTDEVDTTLIFKVVETEV